MAIQWDSNVNKRILRDGTSWSNIVGFKSDETRSGKTKRRSYHSQEKRQFSIKMRFTVEEYMYFSNWYKNTIKQGLYAFEFPKIDSISETLVVYRFTTDGSPQFTNPSGDIIDCTMKWEEV